MTIRHPKYHQGRKDTRIKPVLPIPDRPTYHHDRIDKVLTKAERKEADAERRRRDHENKVARQEQWEAEHPDRVGPHRHKYKRVVRECEDGVHRVVQCNCGHYIMIAKP